MCCGTLLVDVIVGGCKPVIVGSGGAIGLRGLSKHFYDVNKRSCILLAPDIPSILMQRRRNDDHISH